MPDTPTRHGALSHLPDDLERASRPPVLKPHELQVCPVCGQSFDMRDLAQAHHHGPEKHLTMAG
jgi:hypothetical protein